MKPRWGFEGSGSGAIRKVQDLSVHLLREYGLKSYLVGPATKMSCFEVPKTTMGIVSDSWTL